jgi:hypothetical protein
VGTVSASSEIVNAQGGFSLADGRASSKKYSIPRISFRIDTRHNMPLLLSHLQGLGTSDCKTEVSRCHVLVDSSTDQMVERGSRWSGIRCIRLSLISN